MGMVRETMTRRRRDSRTSPGDLRWMLLMVASLCVLPALGAAEDASLDFADMSIEDLMDLEVTSVSKHAESLSAAPAAITVITAEDIRRSGHTSVPEVLRMVPGLQVARIDASRWAISSRGFAGLLSSKLLVLIDGRSVYSPTSSGVYWDVQDVRLEDIERIEVIRGPGGTLWGANAVNGVINIITWEAGDTQGLELGAVFGRMGRRMSLEDNDPGSLEGVYSGRWGGKIGDDFAYRISGLATNRANLDDANGNNAGDGWNLYRGGFRTDWEVSDRDSLTVEADGYGGEGNKMSAAPFKVHGAHLLARWTQRQSENSSTKLQVYYDFSDREQGARFLLHTGDFEFQHDLSFGSSNPFSLAWGANYRLTADDLRPGGLTSFDPDQETQHMASVFGQGRLDFFDDRLAIIGGIKLEYNNFSFNDVEWQPSLRVRGTPCEGHNLWAAVSRAVRTPARTDRDLRLTVLGFPLVSGNPDFKSEKLIAFEQGYRGAILPELTLSLSGFQFLYDDLQTSETAGGPFGPFTMQNSFETNTYGVEAEVAWDARHLLDLLSWMPVDRLRLSAGYSLVYVDAEPLDDDDTVPEHPEGTAPLHQVQFRSLIDLPYDLELDLLGYWVDNLQGDPSLIVPVASYFRLDLRAGWKPSDHVELSVVGQNLTRKRHTEFNLFMDTNSGALTPVVENVPRSVFGKVTLSFF
jgi:iron complex outermembrane receptor protein